MSLVLDHRIDGIGPSAQVIEHSISEEGIEIASVQICMHRYALAEFNTHRAFSRSFRSSRAVPVKRMLEEVRTAPALPYLWGSNNPGMASNEPLSQEDQEAAEKEWRAAAQSAADHTERLMKIGLHKQWANRLLEPFLWVHGLVTSTDWANFFALRDHETALPDFMAVAVAIREALAASTPRHLAPGEWHLPYFNKQDEPHRIAKFMEAKLPSRYTIGTMPLQTSLALRISAARCARVSNKTFDGVLPTIEEDSKLYDRLVGARPVHASPTEHQAMPDVVVQRDPVMWKFRRMHGNLFGYVQHRKLILNETVWDKRIGFE